MSDWTNNTLRFDPTGYKLKLPYKLLPHREATVKRNGANETILVRHAGGARADAALYAAWAAITYGTTISFDSGNGRDTLLEFSRDMLEQAPPLTPEQETAINVQFESISPPLPPNVQINVGRLAYLALQRYEEALSNPN